MSLPEILIIAAVALASGIALFFTLKNRKKGGGCGCSGCSGNCQGCDKK